MPDVIQQLLEMENGSDGTAAESDAERVERVRWVQSWSEYCEFIGKSITELPMGSKRAIDLFKLYRQVQSFGGLVNVYTYENVNNVNVYI